MGLKGPITQGDVLDRITIDADGCWIAEGKPTSDGYIIWGRDEDRKPIYAHIAAFKLWKGPVPKGYHVHHVCEKPPCCRPKCLRAVTRSVNQKQYHTRRHGQMSRADLKVCRFVHGLIGESAKLRMS